MDVCFFFNDAATTDIYTLSLHDALPIWGGRWVVSDTSELVDSADIDPGFERLERLDDISRVQTAMGRLNRDRKSTRLNSSHPSISYAVFCLKKKTQVHP